MVTTVKAHSSFRLVLADLSSSAGVKAHDANKQALQTSVKSAAFVVCSATFTVIQAEFPKKGANPASFA
eukprot:3052562-Rhodomonas_salina.1